MKTLARIEGAGEAVVFRAVNNLALPVQVSPGMEQSTKSLFGQRHFQELKKAQGKNLLDTSNSRGCIFVQ